MFEEFSVKAAQRSALENRLQDWVLRYLKNISTQPLADIETLDCGEAWWHGPIEVQIDRLVRLTGPEPDRQHIVNAQHWEREVQRHTNHLANGGVSGRDLPPVVVNYKHGLLRICYGNCQVEAMRRLGWRTAWAIICYDSEKDFFTHGPTRWMI